MSPIQNVLKLRSWRLVRLVTLFAPIVLINSCSKDPVETAQELVGFGDYTNAESVLKEYLQEKPDDVVARELLAHCFSAQDHLSLELNQYEILNNIAPSGKYAPQLLRLYADIGDEYGYQNTFRQYNNKVDSIISSYNAQLDRMYALTQDPQYSVYSDDTKAVALDVDSIASIILERKYDEWMIGLGLHALRTSEDGWYDHFNVASLIRPSSKRFFTPAVDSILRAMVEPQLPSVDYSDYSYSVYITHLMERGRLFNLIGDLENALESFDAALKWVALQRGGEQFLSGMEHANALQVLCDLEDFSSLKERTDHLLRIIPEDQIVLSYHSIAIKNLGLTDVDPDDGSEYSSPDSSFDKPTQTGHSTSADIMEKL